MVLLGAWAYRQAAPIHERIEAVAEDMGTPTGWITIENGRQFGGTLALWGSWPEVDYTDATTDAAHAAAARYASRLTADGWERQTSPDTSVPRDPGIIAESWQQGGWRVDIHIAGPGSRSQYRLVPDALTSVNLSFDGQG